MNRLPYQLHNVSRILVLAFGVTFSICSLAIDSDQDGIVDAMDAHPSIPRYQVSLGYGHSCALDDNGIVCWGDNYYGQTEVPATLEQPFQVSAAGQDTCALDLFYVTCWGNQGFEIIPVYKPVMMSRNVFHVCVIDADGLQCYRGNNRYAELNVPARLSNPTQVAAGYHHTCALDDNGVICWGSNRYGESDVPAGLVNPRQVTAGHYHTCVLDDRGVQCWGRNREGQLDVPSLVNPRRIESGYDHVCALDDYGLRCWGRNAQGQSDVPALIHPTQAGAGAHHSCAIEAGGIVCWGYDAFGQTEAPVTKLVFTVNSENADAAHVATKKPVELTSVVGTTSTPADSPASVSKSDRVAPTSIAANDMQSGTAASISDLARFLATVRLKIHGNN